MKNNEQPILRVIDINKEFPGVKALTDVSIDFFSGEVHAIMGENGAGKSTLIKIMSGVYTPTSGKIIYEGTESEFKNPRQALDSGISVIHQELSLANDLTVAENIFLGEEPTLNHKGFVIDRKRMNVEAKNVLDKMGVEIGPNDLVGDLSAAYQQMVEIAKVILKNSKVVIMDEPTSSLSEGEVDILFEQIKLLKENNVSIIYISHKLKEIETICDKVTVLRDGEFVNSMLVKETNETEIVNSMVGREIKDYYNKDTHRHKAGEEVLKIEGLTKNGVFENVSFKAHKGEILGFSGLVGSKRTDVMECIFGAKSYDSGRVILRGEEVKFESPKDAIDHKIGFVTEDRRRTGLMLESNIHENEGLPSVARVAKKFGIIDTKWEKEQAIHYGEELNIKSPSISTIVKYLSGGNQQKVVLAKWLIAESDILILDEPTRGIDVNAKSEFYALMNAFVEEGGCIIMVSSELPEILGVSDRIIVMREGKMKGELLADEANEQNIMHLASIDD